MFKIIKRIFLLLSCLFFVSIFPVISAYAIVYAKQYLQNSEKAKWSSKQEPIFIAANSSPQSDLYTQAEILFREKKYDYVIRLLSSPAHTEPLNLKLNFLLAKAQMEKCAILKSKGDMSYKILIHEPYRTGRRLHKIDETLTEPYYIVAKSLLINNRIYRAIRTIKKALYFSPDNPNYLLVMADACSAYAHYQKHFEVTDVKKYYSLAIYNYQKAMEINKDDEEFKITVEKKIKELSEKMK